MAAMCVSVGAHMPRLRMCAACEMSGRQRVAYQIVRPDGHRDVRSVWVVKRAPNGELVLMEGVAKARLCLRGDTTANDGATPTFSPCVGWTAMLVFCSIAAAHGAKILQADVVNAYVQAQLHAHPSIPPTFMPLDADLREMLRTFMPDMPRGRVYSVRVLRALYGLRESARLFHDHFDAVLRKVGFAQLGGEPCLYILRCTSGGFLLIVLHVDDFLHACCSAQDAEFERAHVAITDALDGLLKTSQAAIFVGANITLSDPMADGGPDVLQTGGAMHVSVSSHIAAMLAARLPEDAPPSITDTRVPMAGSIYQRLLLKHGTLLTADSAAATWFRSAIGRALWFAARCRPDISHATHILSRGMCAPTDTHVTAILRLGPVPETSSIFIQKAVQNNLFVVCKKRSKKTEACNP
jgi:hypothetical protein